MFHIKYESVRPCLHGLQLPHRVFEDSQTYIFVSGGSPATAEVSSVISIPPILSAQVTYVNVISCPIWQ